MNPKNTLRNFHVAIGCAAIAIASASISQAQSDNADLFDLAISSGTLDPAFDSATTSYTATVTVPFITVTPTADDAGATITVNGEAVVSGDPSDSITLNLGPNVITTIVTAEDEIATETYTLTVTRELPPTLTTAPVAYWPLRDGNPGDTVPTGTGNAAENVIDIANTFVNGTTNNATSTWEADPFRGIVWSTGEGNRINAGTQGIDLDDGFTWSLWVNVAESNITDPGADSIIGTRQEFNPGVGNRWHKIDLTQIGNWNGTISTPQQADGQWKHLALVGDTTGRRLYINGDLVAEGTSTAEGKTFNGLFEFGGTQRFSEDITGLYSDVAVWNTALTESEILALAAGANVIEDITEPVLIATSPPNEDAEATVVDGLTIIFDEVVNIGSGDIRIYDESGPSLITTIDVTDATQVSPTGAGLLINPTAALVGGVTYYIEMDAGVVKNAEGLDFGGFTGSGTWSFTVDNLAPTVVSISDQYNGTSFGENLTSVDYTITFNEAIDGSTVTAADFENAGSATISIGTVTQTAPEVFLVEVLPSSTGTLQLAIPSGSVILDVSGNALDTTSAILDDITITITSGPTGAVTITGTAGGNNSWNTATNWSGNFTPNKVWGATVAAGVTAQAQDAATPSYSGGLTLQSASQLWINNVAGSQNAIGTGPITFEGATIRMTLNVTPVSFPAMILNGNANFTTGGNTEDNKTRNFAGTISGSGLLTYNMRRGTSITLSGNNTGWSGGFVANNTDFNVNNQSRVRPDNNGFGTGDVTLNDGVSLEILAGRGDTIDDGAALFVNGRGRTDIRKLALNSNETVNEFWLDGVQQAAGDYDSSSGLLDSAGNPLISGSGTLTVLTGPGSPPTLASIENDVDDGPVLVNTPVTYTLTFSKDMDATSIDLGDFGNAGSSSITIGSIDEVSAKVFTVEVTPTTVGTLIFQINQGAVIEDLDEIALDTTTAIEDTTVIDVEDPAPGNPYDDWADGAPFDSDASGDGIANGLAFLLGADEPGDNALGLLPTITEDDGDLILTFSMRNADERGDATLSVQFGNDLVGWTTVVIPDDDGETVVGFVTFDIEEGDPLNNVTITISSDAADEGKLFARLVGEEEADD